MTSLLFLYLLNFDLKDADLHAINLAEYLINAQFVYVTTKLHHIQN